MRVIIAGLGDIGTQLAADLTTREGFELVLIDQDEEKCEALSGEYDALVLHGDGTEPELLESAGARQADALIATTDSDALNMVIAVLGKKFDVSRVVAKLNKTSLRTTARELGVDHVISPKISAATEISSLLHGYDILDFSLLVQGGARLVEISPGELANEKIKDIDLPEGTLITSVLREGVAVIPRGNTELNESDILIIITENEKKEDNIKELFGELQTGRRPDQI
ncbi:NAD-binding protein [Candidatus Bipolaricaulota bacterium]|nr:NAD-binding protein [Candidatus Bipolaricaulota bacterium]MCF7889879.1 NAD-binding protein [Candidatus Bipolaricaulota bacterium]